MAFSLTGFSTFKRDGLELSGTFVASVNAEMKVGSVAETITVTGETPLIDVQSAAVQKVVTKEVVDAIPTGRLGINLAALQPGIILGAGGSVGGANTNSLATQDVGGTSGDSFTDLAIHGGKPAEQRQTIGGVSAATTIRFGESLSSSPSFTAMQEMSVNTSGADASMAGGGVQLNYVPRDGGNTFKGLMFFSGANSAMQGTNYSSGSRDASGVCSPADSLYCRGLVAQPGALVHVYDVNPGYGGPIKKDKLWFFLTARWTEAVNEVPNDYPNKNFIVGQTSPTLLNVQTMTYSPNQTQPLDRTWGGGGHFWEQTARLTWQASAKNKFGFYYNNKKRTYTNGVVHHVARSAGRHVLLPVLGQPGAVVVTGQQQVPARVGVLAPPGNLGQQDGQCEHRRSAGGRHHRQQPAVAGARLHSADQQLPRSRRRNRHGQPQPELPRQLCGLVRHGFAFAQGGLRSERRLPLESESVGRAVQLRRQHAGEQRRRHSASRCRRA